MWQNLRKFNKKKHQPYGQHVHKSAEIVNSFIKRPIRAQVSKLEPISVGFEDKRKNILNWIKNTYICIRMFRRKAKKKS